VNPSDQKRNEEVDPKAPASKDAPTKPEGAPAPKPGLNYVFKIAPADPKNSFDFEDVADK
jgi:hypothetical protein